MGLPTPAYQDEMVSLLKGDALQLLPEIATASVQLIIADVPYMGVKTSYLGQRVEWDRQWKTREAYLSWLRQLAKEWQRVLAPNGSLYCFAAPSMAAHVEVMLEEYFTVIQRITWRKPPYATKAEMFRKESLTSFFPITESILFCEQTINPFGRTITEAIEGTQSTAKEATETIGAYATVNHGGTVSNWMRGIRIPSKQDYMALRAFFQNKLGQERYLREDYEALRRPFTLNKNMPYTDVWTFDTVPSGPGKHPAEKPLALLRHMITVSSRPGDLILDPTCGSGTTLEAARQCGRRAIGFELEAPSIALGCQRLAQQQFPWD
jgi:adenine-specific DNA-methyltransferase